MMRIATGVLVLAACQAVEAPMANEPDATLSTESDAEMPPSLGTNLDSRQLCKLISNRNTSDPSANDLHHRSNVLGTDLGIPVVHDDRMYILFGDTIGYRGIWAPAESHPDAIGYGTSSATAIAEDPSLLCSGLRMISLPAAQSIGPKVDATIVSDFAGVVMTAPPGHALGEFIKNPAGGNNGPTYPFLPGDFEVPSGAFTVGDSIYVFYTTVAGPGNVEMKGSYLAKWSQPSINQAPSFRILYAVDQRFDANGPLGGNFINISAQVSGEYVYLFGTGEFRSSGIHVARKRLDALATPGGFEELGMVVSTPGYGETSVRYFPEIQRWMLLAEQSLPTSNRIVAHLADRPEGPWTDAITIHDMGDPAFRGAYCCTTEDNCQSQQMFNCNRTGFYGTYLFPTVIKDGSDVTITYTMSSFSPYNVALFQTTFSD